MKTDTIFYTLLQNLPSVLFEVLEKSPALASHYEFSSVEIKELARRIDGLFLPKPEYPEDPIYFVEVQFQSDDNLYWRLITEAFLYLNQYKPQKSWQTVVLWANRDLDPGVPLAYQTSLAPGQIHVVYLDEIADTSSSIGLGIIKLVVSPEDEAIQEARSLINLVKKADAENSRDLLELVERMLIYKFSSYSRQELEAMFGLTEWQQTRFYQEVKEELREEVKEETKLEIIPKLLHEGLTIEQIARILELDIEVVRQAIKKESK
ncbi:MULTISPECIES: Rpn family recombination-promoting nuclease/putative transposase [Sphaerospermopsis]|uniref:Rpn family recombination-promoting nuclease/putative transposase n=1 Tax=Sphaerospermopsis torques-reginae ITEP-024 TaxID=984208 RepID=A0ABX8X0L4_9CYAN|nr:MULTISPECIES: Rpn family recombination-promoting nuclease/putative transposase [Sphaerospermopsis]MBE9056889.1 Rpn family recombination-promoting nuclease/putative transposase [Sphaerospermopsis sp. LEGE 08334]QYX31981.1 Rpn family recombination-promoting nuclease/putative transposase [Sphaerospermopsis torques-reginae ITEP-024]